jgi:hypothetical protein
VRAAKTKRAEVQIGKWKGQGRVLNRALRRRSSKRAACAHDLVLPSWWRVRVSGLEVGGEGQCNQQLMAVTTMAEKSGEIKFG